MREGILREISDGFHVLWNDAELAPGGCGWTLMRKVLVATEETRDRVAKRRNHEGESK